MRNSANSVKHRAAFSEAIIAVQTTKESWCEIDIHRIAGEIALQVAGAECG